MAIASHELIARDSAVMSPSLSRVLPLVVESASGSWITDVEGHRYLDFAAGIAVTALGHSHPEVLDAITQQVERFVHVSGGAFYYEQQAALAEELAARTYPDERARVLFTNFGTEAIEAALQLARYHTRRQSIISFHGGYHGRTAGALSVSSSKVTQHAGFGTLVPGTITVPYASEDTATPLDETLRSLQRVFDQTTPPDEVAAVLIEPVQGQGGYDTADPGLLPALRALCDEHGILLIADEIQSGLGRTGRWLATEHSEVRADIVCLGMGLASGLSIGAVLAPESVMTWPPGSQASTFGGNPVCAAAARATVKLLTPQLFRAVEERGNHLRAALSDIPRTNPLVAQVKGRGLMLGLDLIDSPSVSRLIRCAFDAGLVLLPVGTRTVRICPPLTLSADEARHGIELLRQCLGEVAATTPTPSVT
jgi:4-aminobutyrate aminotransferase